MVADDLWSSVHLCGAGCLDQASDWLRPPQSAPEWGWLAAGVLAVLQPGRYSNYRHWLG